MTPNHHSRPGQIPAAIHRADAIESGLTDWMLRHDVAGGDLERLYHGMYAAPVRSFTTDDGRVVGADAIEARRDHYRRRVIAAARVGEERKAASYQSAAALHSIAVLGLPEDIHFTADRHSGGVVRAVRSSSTRRPYHPMR